MHSNLLFLWTVIILVLESSAASSPEEVSNSTCSWQTGPWGSCFSPEGCGHGRKERGVTCVKNSDGFVLHESDCDIERKPATWENCFRVCESHKPFLRWSTGLWSPCIPLNPSRSNCESPGVGEARRTVLCLYRLEGKGNKRPEEVVVDHESCNYFWSRPETSMICSYDCPEDCAVTRTDLSSTGLCNSSCNDLATDTPTYAIVVAPGQGGRACLPHQRTLTDCHNASKCLEDDSGVDRYFLKVGNWSPCLSENSVFGKDYNVNESSSVPLIGQTKRNLTCQDVERNIVDLRLCQSSDKISVELEQRCLVPIDCELSPWTAWTVEREGCVNSENAVFPETRIRRRHLVRIPLGNGRPCGPLYEERRITQNLPECNKYKWYPLEWSECSVFQHDSSKVIIHKTTCGGGTQVRNIICLRVSDQIPVDDVFCKEPRPYEIQRCEVQCPIDCVVSHWSAWGPCLPHEVIDNHYQLVESGYARRSRNILVSPSNGGSSCPHLEEKDNCDNFQVTHLHFGNWSSCLLQDAESQCGIGNRTRDFSCVSWTGNELEKFFCHHHLPIIETVEECQIPCPNDCIVSEWSDWSKCSHPCYTSRHWGLMSRNRTILAVNGPGGRNCDDERKEKDYCNSQSCDLLHWTTSNWSHCEFKQKDNNCGNGVKKREIFCAEGTYLHKDHIDCKFLEKPTDSQECFVPCPEDCLVTQFTKWSPCSSTPYAVQQRQRYVERISKHGGKVCPLNLVESKSCDEVNDILWDQKTEVVISYSWKVGNWGECVLPVISNPSGKGFQIRNVTCVDDSDHAVEMHHCIDPREVTTSLELLTTSVPQSFRLCQVICPSNQTACKLSSWSMWSSCIHAYKSTRSRTREILDGSFNEIHCQQQFSLMEEEDCPYLSPDLSNTIDTQWKSCIVSNKTAVGVNGRTILYSCGYGYRYKAGLELIHENDIEPGVEEDLCVVNCPIDCMMSQWSGWSECGVPCGHGIRQRNRRVVIEANHLGRPCPPDVKVGMEVQLDVCGSPCSEYKWRASGWNRCRVTKPKAHCGSGLHHRNVRCIKKITEEDFPEVYCDPLYRPEESGTCRVFCPGECVVSSWEITQECPEPCNSRNFQVKTRQVLRRPDLDHKCKSLVKTELCFLNKTCFEHSWVIGEWSSCILPQHAICGKGIQKRSLMCVRSDKQEVDATHCEKIHKKPPSLQKPLLKPCYVDCPVDCIMSDWSEWNTAECMKCGGAGVMSRHRSVLQAPSEYGQSCPSNLIQKQPCPFKPCYHWNTSEWSKCDLQGADCGSGVRRRLVHCLQYDGLQVGKIHCLLVNVTFEVRSWLDTKWLVSAQDKAEEEECYVRCPGDCVYSQWSAWSHCHRNCASGQKVGYQTSSRMLLVTSNTECTEEIMRTRPCWDDNECLTFEWTMRNKTRVCMRSDGLEVSGACSSEPKTCFKGCNLANGAECDVYTGLCTCQNRFGHRISLHNAKAISRCVLPDRSPKKPLNHAVSNSDIQLKYYPDDSKVSFWMFAMILIGSAFVIFVFVTVYLMCRSTMRQRVVSVHRQGSLRRKVIENNAQTEAAPNSYQ